MKRTVLFFTATILLACSQETPVSQTEPSTSLNPSEPKDTSTVLPPEERDRKCKCVDTAITTEGKRFPFDRCAVAMVYQFKDTVIKYEPVYEDLVKDKKFQRKYIVQKKSLSPENLKELEFILFKRVRVCDDGQMVLKDDCSYLPHHCIVFYDDNKLAYAFLEICFTCEKHMTKPGWDFGSFCGDTYCDLRHLFKKAGMDPEAMHLYMCSEPKLP